MPRYFCRLCDSSNNWKYPSGAAIETICSHFGKFGFAYEEWNFNEKLRFEGFQHGWLEAFKPMRGHRHVPLGSHEIALYVRRGGNSYFVGRIEGCENISGTDLQKPYPSEFAGCANRFGCVVLVGNNLWQVSPIITGSRVQQYTQIPYSNMRFSVGSVSFARSASLINLNYKRYGALLVDGYPQREELWKSLPDLLRS